MNFIMTHYISEADETLRSNPLTAEEVGKTLPSWLDWQEGTSKDNYVKICPTDLLTLNQFRETKVRMEKYDDISMEFPGYVYADSCFIEICTGEYEGQFLLIIFNEQWMDTDLAKLERNLYELFYIPEFS
jgi:hypothetical protein